MAYQALYRKYRPQTFSDVVGQEHITETLKHELASGKISHAYLFTGTRGTGKTSCAKILAKAINCLNPQDGDPCGECEMCRAVALDEITDIVEIDAASNNGVDDIRELREQVSFHPVSAKFRVYIIDEVHMLSAGAFNALLKTIEEPPKYVVFILATTEVHKIPATILSRCQRFDFRRIDSEKIRGRIQTIADKEGFTVTEEAATLIASAADGGMRDALSILDLCAAGTKEIDESVVTNVCAMASNAYLLRLADCVRERDTAGALLLLDELHNSSVDMLRLLSELTVHFRNLMIIKAVKGENKPIVCSSAQLKALEEQAKGYDLREIMAVLRILQDTAGRMQTGNRRCEMEMTVIRLCNPAISADLVSLERRVYALENNLSARHTAAPTAAPRAEKPTQSAPITQAPDEEDIPLPSAPPAADNTAPEPDRAVPESDSADSAPTDVQDAKPVPNWNEVIKILWTTCPLIAGVLNDSKAYTRGTFLLIDTQNGQFRSLVNGNDTAYRDHIRSAAQQVLGETYKLGPYRPAKAASGDPLTAFADRLKDFDIR